MLDQEGGCTLEELFAEDEHCLNQLKSSNARLTEFMCQRETLQKLITYATKMPADPEDHTLAHKYPFIAADILTANKTIAKSLVEGGWQSKPEPDTQDAEEDDIALRMVSNSLKEANDKKETKETLVEELDLKEDGSSEQVQIGANEDQDEEAKSVEAAEVKSEPPENDYSLLEQLVDGFFETCAEDMLPVLCGYFNKIVCSLVTKEKQRVLEYLLLKKDGAIFDAIGGRIEHHSLALLLTELLQIQIKPEPPQTKASAQYEWENSDQENAEDEPEGTLTPEQEQMQAILRAKGQRILLGLLDAFSHKNDDLERTLNANAILMEFCENDHCFAMLTHPDVLQKLIRVCCQTQRNLTNLAYALNLLQTIIREFGGAEKEISDERKQQIQLLFVKYFPDMAYNCVMILMAQNSGEGFYTNQTMTPVRKIGPARLRAMELLKTLFVTVAKMKDGKDLVTPLLRVRVIDTLLHMIKAYPFCCVSHQQCIMILNSMKDTLDKNDVAKLQQFILVELEAQSAFEFPSGRTTSGANMGQISQIAFELRQLTQQEINNESSDEDEDPSSAKLERRDEIAQWLAFCTTKIDKIERVWNRKLEEADSTHSDDNDSLHAKDDDSLDYDHERAINAALDQAEFHRLSRSHVQKRTRDQVTSDLQAVKDSLKPLSKDDSDALNDLGAKEDFAHNNYWRAPEVYSIDDLMNELTE